MGKLDEKYGMCENYFYTFKCTKRFKTMNEAEAYFIRRMELKKNITEEYQRIYYELVEASSLSSFGRFLKSKGLIKNARSISTMLGIKFRTPTHKIFSERKENFSMKLIEAYEEYKDLRGIL